MFDAMYALYYFNIFYHTWVMKRNHFKYNIIASITFLKTLKPKTKLSFRIVPIGVSNQPYLKPKTNEPHKIINGKNIFLNIMFSPKINGLKFLKISLNLKLTKHPFYKKNMSPNFDNFS